jgi:hypothetical protein
MSRVISLAAAHGPHTPDYGPAGRPAQRTVAGKRSVRFAGCCSWLTRERVKLGCSLSQDGTEPGQRGGVGVLGRAGVADDEAGPLAVGPADSCSCSCSCSCFCSCSCSGSGSKALQAVEGQAAFGGPGDDVALTARP